jgi:hypothetical protein
MHTPYHSLEQFREKAGLLAGELALESDEALSTLAHISGYETANDIRFSVSESPMLSSREELMARLQAIYPDIDNEKAADVIDKLNLPVRATDMAEFARSPGAAPNISG